jgi:hypothetical protein
MCSLTSFTRSHSNKTTSRGDDWVLTSTSGAPHKVRRAIASRYYSGPAAKNYQSVQQDETLDLLRVIAASPDDLRDHLKRFVAPHIPTFTSLQTHL